MVALSGSQTSLQTRDSHTRLLTFRRSLALALCLPARSETRRQLQRAYLCSSVRRRTRENCRAEPTQKAQLCALTRPATCKKLLHDHICMCALSGMHVCTQLPPFRDHPSMYMCSNTYVIRGAHLVYHASRSSPLFTRAYVYVTASSSCDSWTRCIKHEHAINKSC